VYEVRTVVGRRGFRWYGSFNLPHAETDTTVQPRAAAYNRGAAPEAMRRVARAHRADDAPQGLYDLAAAKVALRDIGLAKADLERPAGLATANPYGNPEPVTRAGIRGLLEDA
jgi:maleylacetate reductase